jgi:hypothetical protein
MPVISVLTPPQSLSSPSSLRTVGTPGSRHRWPEICHRLEILSHRRSSAPPRRAAATVSLRFPNYARRHPLLKLELRPPSPPHFIHRGAAANRTTAGARGMVTTHGARRTRATWPGWPIGWVADALRESAHMAGWAWPL